MPGITCTYCTHLNWSSSWRVIGQCLSLISFTCMHAHTHAHHCLLTILSHPYLSPSPLILTSHHPLSSLPLTILSHPYLSPSPLILTSHHPLSSLPLTTLSHPYLSPSSHPLILTSCNMSQSCTRHGVTQSLDTPPSTVSRTSTQEGSLVAMSRAMSIPGLVART